MAPSHLWPKGAVHKRKPGMEGLGLRTQSYGMPVTPMVLTIWARKTESASTGGVPCLQGLKSRSVVVVFKAHLKEPFQPLSDMHLPLFTHCPCSNLIELNMN